MDSMTLRLFSEGGTRILSSFPKLDSGKYSFSYSIRTIHCCERCNYILMNFLAASILKKPVTIGRYES